MVVLCQADVNGYFHCDSDWGLNTFVRFITKGRCQIHNRWLLAKKLQHSTALFTFPNISLLQLAAENGE